MMESETETFSCFPLLPLISNTRKQAIENEADRNWLRKI